jgi:mannitol/fructose-specific phosphotransferase system IIA component (Ntr-type)
VRLVDLFPPARIRIGLAARDKGSVIEELVGLLPLPDEASRAGVLLAVTARESESSTGIGRGVAIPHGRAAAVPHLMGALGTAPKGLPFDAIDGEPCRLFVLLVSGPADAQAHGKALARVARLLNRPGAKESLAAAATPDEVLEVLASDEAD